MQTHINQSMAACPAFGFDGSGRWNTRIVETNNGKEKRVGLWLKPRHTFTAPYRNISVDAWRGIRDMFNVARGRLLAFRFLDHREPPTVDAQFGIGDGAQTVFQLSTAVTIDGLTFTRVVSAPRAGVSVSIDGVPSSPTISDTTGTVTFAVAPAIGAVLRWSGTYDLWVRFDSDDLPFSLDNINAHNGSVSVVEVEPPSA